MSKWISQLAWFGLFAALIGFFSTAPSYRHLEPNQALLKVSIRHAGQILGECHVRSAEELGKLSPNMQALEDCPRERSPVTIEVELDGAIWYRDALQPSGLARDGAATVYRRFPVQAGTHRLTVRINDSAKLAGFNYQHSEVLQLRPAQVAVVDFNREQGGIVFKQAGAGAR